MNYIKSVKVAGDLQQKQPGQPQLLFAFFSHMAEQDKTYPIILLKTIQDVWLFLCFVCQPFCSRFKL